MSTHSNSSIETGLMFQLKGGLYPLSVLQLLGTDLAAFESQLSSKIQQAPKFFQNAPVIVDLQKLSPAEPVLDFKELMHILRRQKLIPVGIKGARAQQQAAATLAGLPTLQESAKESQKSELAPVKIHTSAETHTEKKTTTVPETEPEIHGSNTRLITEPVRSGQQIYARGGDLIVLASVSHGAELLADGHIHVYGPLRGRALAGVTGDESAHIFCQSLEAELISIAGQYKISEDIEQAVWRLGADISLAAGHLKIQPL